MNFLKSDPDDSDVQFEQEELKSSFDDNDNSNEPKILQSTKDVELPLILFRPDSPKRCFRGACGKRRIMSKRGRLNIFLSKVPNKHLKYVRDIGHMLLTIQWRWILLTICAANAIAYFAFAAIWMSLAWLHGDMSKNTTTTGDNGSLCVYGTNTFPGYLLLSIETLTTIGFGIYYPTESCPQGWIILTLQALTNIAIDGILVSAVYVKISKPNTKDSRRLFSNRAVVCLRDGKLRLIFRICDKTEKHRTKTKIRAYFINKKISDEGEKLPNFMTKLKLEPQGLLIWPLEIVHTINQSSPLWNTSARDLLSTRFEIVAVIGGDSIITGQPSQSQTSYLSNEILWGHRFDNCVEFDVRKECYFVNYKKFNKTVATGNTPLCSAQLLKQIQTEYSVDVENSLNNDNLHFGKALGSISENFRLSQYDNA